MNERPLHPLIVRPRQQAFTLVEVLLALTIGGMLLVAVAALLFSLSNMTLSLRQGDPLHRHSQGLERILYHSFAQMTSPPSANSEDASNPNQTENDTNETPNNNNNSTGGDSEEELLSWQKLEDLNPLSDPLLSFFLPQAPAFVSWDGRATGGVQCHLYFNKDEGLYLLWQPQLAYIQFDEDIPTYQTMLSPYVTQLSYAYYDQEEERWEISAEPEKEGPDQYPLPQALQITLHLDREDSEDATLLWIALPASLPLPLP